MAPKEEIKRILENHEKRISVLEKILRASPPPVIKRISINEFILSKNSKNDVDRTLAVGYFLGKYEHMSSFNVRDLENGFRLAKERVPLNINDKVNMNIGKGMMMEVKQKKDNLRAWVLTNTGEKFVENNFKKAK